MSQTKFDSEAFLNRLTFFGQKTQKLVSTLPKFNYNLEYSSQIIRSSASPGANYIEALEALGKKDFIHRLRICRKETRETVYWLRMIVSANSQLIDFKNEATKLMSEGNEIVKILTSSIITLERKV